MYLITYFSNLKMKISQVIDWVREWGNVVNKIGMSKFSIRNLTLLDKNSYDVSMRCVTFWDFYQIIFKFCDKKTTSEHQNIDLNFLSLKMTEQQSDKVDNEIAKLIDQVDKEFLRKMQVLSQNR